MPKSVIAKPRKGLRQSVSFFAPVDPHRDPGQVCGDPAEIVKVDAHGAALQPSNKLYGKANKYVRTKREGSGILSADRAEKGEKDEKTV